MIARRRVVYADLHTEPFAYPIRTIHPRLWFVGK